MFRTCVSLLPAATQMILDMGLADSLRGVTHFCPLQAQKRYPVLLRIQDGQAHLQVSTIQELQPDVIFTQSTCQACLMDEEELKNQLVGMAEPVRTLSLDPLRLEEVFGAALQIADALGWPEQGKAYVEALRRRVDQISACLQKTPFSRCRVGFLEWLDPVFHAGHWIPDQICLAGGVDPLAKPGQKANPYHGSPSWLQTQRFFCSLLVDVRWKRSVKQRMDCASFAGGPISGQSGQNAFMWWNPICTRSPVRPPWWKVWSYWHTCSILKYFLTMETDQHASSGLPHRLPGVQGDDGIPT